MSSVLKNIRILPTARAIKLLQDRGIIFISRGKRLKARGGLKATFAGWGNPGIIRRYAALVRQQDLDIRDVVINLDIARANKPGTSITSRTRWLIEKIKESGGAHKLSEIISEVGETQDAIEGEIAFELKDLMQGMAGKTVDLERAEAASFVQAEIADFIDLANLSKKGDSDITNFITNVLLKAVIMHHKGTVVHQGEVTFRAAAVAVEMGIRAKSNYYQRLITAALLHDVGKIAIPDELLDKKGELSKAEINIIRWHLPVTIFMLEKINWLKNIVPIIQHHHDKAKGDGYPQWLKEGKYDKDIWTCIEILQAADAFDGMIANRPYKEKGVTGKTVNGDEQKVFDPESALVRLEKIGLDWDIVHAIRTVSRESEIGLSHLKDYFDKDELKLVWFGIRHVVKKRILPPSGGAERRSFLRKKRALLWLIKEMDIYPTPINGFIDEVRGEIGAMVREHSIGEEWADIQQLGSEIVEPLEIILYRAIIIDKQLVGGNFYKLIRLIHRNRADAVKIKEITDSFHLTEDDYGNDYFEWVSSVLNRCSTADLPTYGERAFVSNVDRLVGQATLRR